MDNTQNLQNNNQTVPANLPIVENKKESVSVQVTPEQAATSTTQNPKMENATTTTPKTNGISPNWKENLAKLVSKIPYFGTPDMPLVSTTQDHLPISDIVDDVVLYKDGGAAIVLETSSLNFGLLSEKEQGAVVAAYAALINSLSFSIQIMVRTQRKDISGYIRFFDEASKKITNPKLAAITDDYRHFITESIKKKTVLGKRFFIVIPFNSLELGVTKSAMTALKRGPLPFPKDYVVKKAKVTLFPKRDHLIRQASRLGLKLKQLTTSELVDLYYQINNPEPPAVKKDI
ncbi:MAG: hypothetical protein WA152_02040 [Microgenomates group bacterium]